MKASTLYLKVKDAFPDANVFVRCGNKFYSIEEVILTTEDPAIMPPTTVILDGKELEEPPRVQ
jgi:hypothetical protein